MKGIKAIYFFCGSGAIAAVELTLRRSVLRSDRCSAQRRGETHPFRKFFIGSVFHPSWEGMFALVSFCRRILPLLNNPHRFMKNESIPEIITEPEPFIPFPEGRQHPVIKNSRKGRVYANANTPFLFVIVWLLFFSCTSLSAQPPRTDVSLNTGWRTVANDTNQNAFSGFQTAGFSDKAWKPVDVPHNWDAYEGYRRQRHGNRHGYAWYRKTFTVKPQPANKKFFLFFEGVGSYATVWLNGKLVGSHAGGRTTFTLDVSRAVTFNRPNLLAVRADHPANIKDLPWVCGGCSDERGFSEGSQPMGLFRPVHLIITNDVRIEPFGVHVWNDTAASEKSAKLYFDTEFYNYSNKERKLTLGYRVLDAKGSTVMQIKPSAYKTFTAGEGLRNGVDGVILDKPHLWSLESPYLYTLVAEVMENGKVMDGDSAKFGIRTIKWQLSNASSKQFLLNGKPVFINGIAEYEHLLGGSHAFSDEEIRSRVMQIKAAGFNAFRDAHHPHNLRYQQYWDSLGLLWWTQLSAHVWYDTPAFRDKFRTALKEWVRERRNSPSLVLWGLQNESKLPEDFAKDCSEIIRGLDPTASSQRLITTCNGGAGTDWDVPQNWTGTYGGNPATYSEDLKKQILVGEYGAWRTLDLHTEGDFVQNGAYSEDRMGQLMETKIRLAEAAKDSSAGHFMWLYSSHDNPGRVQGGEGYRELDRIGPVNYKGLLTPWGEPTDAFYLYRSNYAPKDKEPMVYIVSHTWPDRWTKPGKKSGIVVYSNCDEVELFNDVRSVSLGRKKRGGLGTHFTWDDVDVRYNVLYAVGYVNGKEAAHDCLVLHHLPKAPHLAVLSEGAKDITAPQPGYNYLYRVACGGPEYTDGNNNTWLADRELKPAGTWGSTSWTADFAGMPPYFASQRTTADPVRGTKDGKLFQNFRYGRESLRYDFPVQDGEYLVELYFAEPWLGKGGGMDCTGWRLFDVALNGNVVLKDLDIWKEAGPCAALKKTVKARITGGVLTVHFPRVAAGQALISAIAVATLDGKAKPALPSQPLVENLYTTSLPQWKVKQWLNTGDEQFGFGKWTFGFLPSYLYGAAWIQTQPVLPKIAGNVKAGFNVTTDADVYVAYQYAKPLWLTGFAETKDSVVNSEGTVYKLYKKRFTKGEKVNLEVGQADLYSVFAVPASNIEPAYDLKPVTSYKALSASLQGPGLKRKTVDGKERIVFEAASGKDILEWMFNVGAADVYSLTVSYNNPLQKTSAGKLKLRSADGTVMKEEAVIFTPTKEGKWNYITTNTGSMINAGNYKIDLSVNEGAGLVVNALDVQ